MAFHFPFANRARALRRVCLVAAGLAFCHSALAVLGKPLPPGTPTVAVALPAASSAAQGASAKAATGAAPGYQTSTTTLERGTVVTEYATGAGVVFAVSWQGPQAPDMGTLLGSYFAGFNAQADAGRSSRNIGTPLTINTPNLVVYSGGRMRMFNGYAYDPGLVPAGLTVNDIFR